MKKKPSAPLQEKVECPHCHQWFSPRGITRHLNTCKARQQQEMEERMRNPGPNDIPVYTLKIRSKDNRRFWFRIDIDGTATFRKLDRLIRTQWFDLDHLSLFSFKQFNIMCSPFRDAPEWEDYDEELVHSLLLMEQIPSSIRALGGFGRFFTPDFRSDVELHAVFRLVDRCLYEYDLGTTSTCEIKVEKVRIEDRDSLDGWTFLAENEEKSKHCSFCSKEATTVDYFIDPKGPVYYCDSCFEKLLDEGKADECSAEEYRSSSPRSGW